jgi:hypothetical protein
MGQRERQAPGGRRQQVAAGSEICMRETIHLTILSGIVLSRDSPDEILDWREYSYCSGLPARPARGADCCHHSRCLDAAVGQFDLAVFLGILAHSFRRLTLNP